jgi:hypothetical protein
LSAAIAQLQVNEMLSVIANDRILFLTISRYDHATNPLFERLGNGQLFSLLEGDGQYDPGAVGNAILTNPDAIEQHLEAPLQATAAGHPLPTISDGS